MQLLDMAMLFGAGILAGVANTVAGGGSLLAVPLLIHLGYAPKVANATSRPALVFQNLSGLLAFHHGGVLKQPLVWRRGLLYALAAVPGSIAGAWCASVRIDDKTFERLLSVVLVGVLIYTRLRRSRARLDGQERTDRPGLATLGFLLLGFYGGFIQAGIGFLIVALLLNTTRFSLAEINAQKIFVVLLFTPLAIVVFASQGLIEWWPATVLIAAQSAGGYLGGWLSVKVDERILLNTYSLLLLVFAISLLV